MSVTLVAHTTAGSSTSGGGSVTSPPVNTATATLLVAALGYYTGIGGYGFISDSLNNTWTVLPTRGTNGGGCVQMAYVLGPATGASQTFTIDDVAASAYASISVGAFSASGGAIGALDLNVGASGDQPGSATPSFSNELILTGVNFDVAVASPTVDSGFTIAAYFDLISGGGEGSGLAYLLQGAGAPINPTWGGTATGNANTAMISFQTPAAAAAAAPRPLAVVSQAVNRAGSW